MVFNDFIKDDFIPEGHAQVVSGSTSLSESSPEPGTFKLLQRSVFSLTGGYWFYPLEIGCTSISVIPFTATLEHDT